MNLNSLSLAGTAPAPMKPAAVRRAGMALIVIGSLLACGVGYLVLQLAPTLLHPGELIGGQRFTGSAELGRQMLLLLGVVALTGATAAGIGAYQWRTGQRKTWLVALGLSMLAATIGLAVRTSTMLG